MLKYYNVNKKWKYLKAKMREQYADIKLTEDQKVCTFFKNTLLPRKLATKFPYVLNNSKKDYIGIQAARKFLSPHNKFVLGILVTGFLMMYLALLNLYRDLEDATNNEDRVLLCPNFYNLAVFNTFIKIFFNEYYFNNETFQDLNVSFLFDKQYNDTYINYFNFYLFFNLKIFEVILHFEKFKYEEDVILYGEKKAKEKKLLVDHYDIDVLKYQDNLFFSFSIYEFYLDYYDYLFNFFNYDFFSRTKIFLSEITNFREKQKDTYTYYLTSVYYDYCTEFLNTRKKGKINNSILINKILYTDYKALNIKKKDKFNIDKHILDLKYLGLRMPYLFFLLYTWYSIYYRRVRYNFYIRGYNFFQEYASRMYYFIWANNPAGKNRTKLFVYKYQKLFTISHLKSYIEIKMFNDWFFFYTSYKTYLVKYINNDKKAHAQALTFLLNNINLQALVQSKKVPELFISIFFNDHLRMNDYNYEVLQAYRLFMKTPVTKFNSAFKFGKLSFLEYDKMIEVVYFLPLDKLRLQKFLERNLATTYYFKIFNTLYLNFYFIKDLYNLKNLKELNKYYKIISFYDKIFSIIFFLIDSFFFKYYWKRCFPRKWHKIWNIYYYIWSNLFIMKYNYETIEFNIKKYDFLMYFLTWRIDTSSSVCVNYAYTDSMVNTYTIINMLYKNRFIELIKQINALLRFNHINHQYRYSYYYYLANLKNYYFDMLHENIEYFLIYFFNNLQKFSNIIYNSKISYIKEFIYFNFIYRYYISVILFETHYYSDWFENWDKRILWIFKNFHKHEGSLFYSKIKTIL